MLNSKNKPTLILGASDKTHRISYQVSHRLINSGEEVHLVGRGTEISGVEIQKEIKDLSNIHTVSLYLSAKNQEDYYDFILGLKPSRVIFNPGAENPELSQLLKENGIFSENACTLVLLSTNQY